MVGVLMRVGVMTVGVMSVGEITVGVAQQWTFVHVEDCWLVVFHLQIEFCCFAGSLSHGHLFHISVFSYFTTHINVM
jgi:hypothetical protein